MMTKHENLQVLRRRDVERIIGLSRSTIYNLMAEDAFPTPIRLGARAVGWLESDIRDWLSQRIAGEIEP